MKRRAMTRQGLRLRTCHGQHKGLRAQHHRLGSLLARASRELKRRHGWTTWCLLDPGLLQGPQREEVGPSRLGGHDRQGSPLAGAVDCIAQGIDIPISAGIFHVDAHWLPGHRTGQPIAAVAEGDMQIGRRHMRRHLPHLGTSGFGRRQAIGLPITALPCCHAVPGQPAARQELMPPARCRDALMPDLLLSTQPGQRQTCELSADLGDADQRDGNRACQSLAAGLADMATAEGGINSPGSMMRVVKLRTQPL